MTRPLDYAGSAAPPVASRIPAMIDEMAKKLGVPKSLYQISNDSVTVLCGTEVVATKIPKSVVARIAFCQQVRAQFEGIAAKRAERRL